MPPENVDTQLRALVAQLAGQARNPVGSSFHLHQLDGARMEAMVHLEAAGVRVEWVHGRGTCAITGEGRAILSLLRGTSDIGTEEARGAVTLYGDRELARRAALVFGPSASAYTDPMAEAGTVTGLAEVVLWSRDLERSLAFYRDLFGLQPMAQEASVKPRFLRVSAGSGPVPQMVVLVPHPDPDGAFPAEKPGRTLHHLAFSVAPDRYDTLADACRAAGLEVRDGVHPVLPGVRTFYVDDPDGNEVEVIAPALAGGGTAAP